MGPSPLGRPSDKRAVLYEIALIAATTGGEGKGTTGCSAFLKMAHGSGLREKPQNVGYTAPLFLLRDHFTVLNALI